jgi:photosystem II stability/assembly factor-like uncharacterized protein
MHRKKLKIIISFLIVTIQACSNLPATPIVIPLTATATFLPSTLTPTETPIPTNTPIPTPTSIPLVWKQISPGQDFDRAEILTIVQDSNDKNIIYLKTERTGVYQSIDGGITWQSSLKNIPLSTIPSIPSGLQLPGKCTSFAIDLNNNSIAYCGIGQGIFRTRDTGKNWDLSNPKVKWIKAIIISSANPNILYAGGTGFSISEDGGQSWKQSNSGLGITYFELILNPRNEKIMYVHLLRNLGDDREWNVYKSPNGGRNWELFNGGSRIYGGNFFVSENGTMYKSIAWNIWRSNDEGTNWTLFRQLSQVGTQQIVNHPTNPFTFYILASDFLKLSLDGGVTWINPDLNMGGINPRLYFTRDIKMIYAASSQKVEKSLDMGAHWTNCQVVNFAFSDSETKLAVSPQDSNKVFLATDGQGVIVSEDGCASWHKSNVGLKNLYVNTLAIDSSGIIYAGTDGGAYISADDGQTWGQVNDGLLGSMIVYSIAVDSDSNVYAATPYGIFKLEKK